MQILKYDLPRTHKLYLFGDTHEGTILKHRKGLKKMIAKIKRDPLAYACHMGDSVENIMIDDKRYNRETVDPNTGLPLTQYEEVVKELWDIKEKLLVMLEGNHDIGITAKVGNILRDNVCRDLGDGRDIFGTYMAKLVINDPDGELMYKGFLAHGFGSLSSTADDPVRRKANRVLSLKRKLADFAGDCIFMAMGHTHQLLVKEPISELYLVDDGKDIQQRYTNSMQTAEFIPKDLRWYVNTGCFYKLFEMGVSGYAERSGYKPMELGYVVVDVVDGVIKEIRPELI